MVYRSLASDGKARVRRVTRGKLSREKVRRGGLRSDVAQRGVANFQSCKFQGTFKNVLKRIKLLGIFEFQALIRFDQILALPFVAFLFDVQEKFSDATVLIHRWGFWQGPQNHESSTTCELANSRLRGAAEPSESERMALRRPLH